MTPMGDRTDDQEFLQKLEECFEEAFSDERELNLLLISQGYDPKKDVEEGLKRIGKVLWQRHREMQGRCNELLERSRNLERVIREVNECASAALDGSGRVSALQALEEIRRKSANLGGLK